MTLTWGPVSSRQYPHFTKEENTQSITCTVMRHRRSLPRNTSCRRCGSEWSAVARLKQAAIVGAAAVPFWRSGLRPRVRNRQGRPMATSPS